MRLSIIIVSWNVCEQVCDCLQSIECNAPGCSHEVILIDNASSDGTVETVRRRFPNVALIANEHNDGFAKANNEGICRSSGEYILLLNPDTIVHRHSLDPLIDFMQNNEDIGACGPRLLNEDGTIQASARRFPTLRNTFYFYTIARFFGLFRGHYKKWRMKDFDHAHQMDVDQVMGAALIVRRTAMEQMDGLDEAFFMYYEEVDLCYRLKQAGWRVVFTPTAEITHLGGQSIRQIPAKKRIMSLRSLLTFLRKHRGRKRMLVYMTVFKPGVILQDAANLLIAIATYLFALLLFDRDKRLEAARKIGRTAHWLRKYSWQILFKI
mgnify:FL=1